MSPAERKGRGRLLVIAGVAGGLLLFLGANAHLLYVALASRSECVDHLKLPGDARQGQYRAAKSAC